MCNKVLSSPVDADLVDLRVDSRVDSSLDLPLDLEVRWVVVVVDKVATECLADLTTNLTVCSRWEEVFAVECPLMANKMALWVVPDSRIAVLWDPVVMLVLVVFLRVRWANSVVPWVVLRV
jgi:hypothetical protein